MARLPLINLASGLSMKGKSFSIDLDPQGNATNIGLSHEKI